MQILKEFNNFTNQENLIDDILTEADLEKINKGKTSKKYFMRGILQRADAQNGNGRIYPKRVLQREINNYMKLVQARRASGELDHSDSAVIELKNVSHLITDIWWDGNDVVGKVEVLSTPSGMILRNLIDDNVTLGISSRGLGSTKQEGGRTVVEDDFQLICWDFVSDPSTDGAFMRTINESRELSANELKEIKNSFDINYRLNRIINEIL